MMIAFRGDPGNAIRQGDRSMFRRLQLFYQMFAHLAG